MGYRATRADPTEAGDPLIRLWTENLSVHGDPQTKLKWFYVDGPAARGEAFLLRAPDDAPVGCVGMRQRDLARGDTRVRAALLADFVVDKHHRSALPALTLQRAAQRHVDAAYDLSYGFPNDSATAVLRRVGYHELGHMTRYVRVLRHESYLEQLVGDLPGLSLGAGAIDRARVAATALQAVPSRARFALRWLSDFDARFDELAARPMPLIHCQRTSALLRWRFVERSGIAALVERRGGRVHAYAVVRGAPGAPAELADLFGADRAATSALLALLVPALYSRGHRTVGLRYLGDPALPQLLVEHGFRPRSDRRVVVVHVGPRCPIDAATAHDANAWYLTDLDEDT